MNRTQRRAAGDREPAELDLLAWTDAFVVVRASEWRADVPPVRIHVSPDTTAADVVEALRAAADKLEQED